MVYHPKKIRTVSEHPTNSSFGTLPKPLEKARVGVDNADPTPFYVAA